jgi:hypothetical protein
MEILIAGISPITSTTGDASPARPIPEEQIDRLMESAWKEKIDRLDALVYKHTIELPKSEEEIRQKHEKSLYDLWDIYETHSAALEQEQRNRQVQKNVEWALQAQKAGRRVKQRIRIDRTHLRVDQILILPEMVLLEGTPYEQKRPATEYGPDDPYEMTFLYIEQKEYRYNHMSQSVTIFARSKPTMIRDIQEFTSQTKILQGFLGTTTGSEDPLYAPDPEKIRRLAETGFLDRDQWLTIVPDPNVPERNVRIEIGQGEKPQTILICDKEDYSRVYELKVFFPKTGNLIIHRTFSQFDENGFPRRAILTEYDLEGNFKEKEIYTIEEVNLNPDFPPEVFAFDLPKGYEVNDTDPVKLREQNEKKTAEHEKARQIFNTRDAERIKPLLSHPMRSIRYEALFYLSDFLKNDPNELKEIAELMKDDPYREIQKLAMDILANQKDNR